MADSQQSLRDLLGGSMSPVAKVTAWVTILKTRCGSRGKEIAEDVETIYGIATSEEKNAEILKGGFERCVYVTLSCVLASAEMAKYLRAEISKITSGPTRTSMKKASEVAYRSAFATACRQLGVSEVLDNTEETLATLQARWITALPPATEEGDVWPDLASDDDIEVNRIIWAFVHPACTLRAREAPVAQASVVRT
jgi:hypothetical protein